MHGLRQTSTDYACAKTEALPFLVVETADVNSQLCYSPTAR